MKKLWFTVHWAKQEKITEEELLEESELIDVSDHERIEYHVEDIAKYYHNHCDGWEDSWPITITIWDEDYNNLGTFKVERESQPVFYANKVEDRPKEDKK